MIGLAGALLAGSSLAGSSLAGSPTAAEQTSQAGPIGLVLILALLIATVFLIRSMNGRLRRLPPSFDPPAGTAAEPPVVPPVQPPVVPDQGAGERPASS